MRRALPLAVGARSAPSLGASAPPLALVRDVAPAPLHARRWRRLVGRRRGPSISVALVYLGGVCCVAALGAHLLPSAGEP